MSEGEVMASCNKLLHHIHKSNNAGVMVKNVVYLVPEIKSSFNITEIKCLVDSLQKIYLIIVKNVLSLDDCVE
jgi:hypothetical protein